MLCLVIEDFKEEKRFIGNGAPIPNNIHFFVSLVPYAHSNSVWFRVAQANSLLLQRRRWQVRRQHHWRQLWIPKRVSRMYRKTCHHSPHGQMLHNSCPGSFYVDGWRTCRTSGNWKNRFGFLINDFSLYQKNSRRQFWRDISCLFKTKQQRKDLVNENCLII